MRHKGNWIDGKWVCSNKCTADHKPERSVEEIVEEFDSIFVSHHLTFDDKPLQSGKVTDDIKDYLRKTLQAERQRCDEIEAKLSAYMEFVDEMAVETPFNLAFDQLEQNLKEFTQPNNK